MTAALSAIWLRSSTEQRPEEDLAHQGARTHLEDSARGPTGDFESSKGELPSCTSWSRFRDSFLSSPASLPAKLVQQKFRTQNDAYQFDPGPYNAAAEVLLQPQRVTIYKPHSVSINVL